MSIIDDLNAEVDRRSGKAAEAAGKNRLVMTVEAYGHKYTAECPVEVSLDHVLGRVVCPLLLDIGYQPGSLKRLFVDGNPMEWDSAYDD